MQFGICAGTPKAELARTAGYDYLEENAQSLFKGETPDDAWHESSRVKESPLPVYAANALIPADMKITGPSADLPRLIKYITNLTRRAGQLNIRQLIFGSGGARQIPAGFDPQRARAQLVEFLRHAAKPAQDAGVYIVIEPLNRDECNIVTTLAEGLGYMQEINHPNIRLLLDTFHFWKEKEPLEVLEKSMPWITHAHVSDLEGRVPPGMSKTSDYKPIFHILKKHNYKGRISVEAVMKDYPDLCPKAVGLLRGWYDAA